MNKVSNSVRSWARGFISVRLILFQIECILFYLFTIRPFFCKNKPIWYLHGNSIDGLQPPIYESAIEEKKKSNSDPTWPFVQFTTVKEIHHYILFPEIRRMQRVFWSFFFVLSKWINFFIKRFTKLMYRRVLPVFIHLLIFVKRGKII